MPETPTQAKPKSRFKMSAAARANMSRAAKARYARLKTESKRLTTKVLTDPKAVMMNTIAEAVRKYVESETNIAVSTLRERLLAVR